MNSIRGTIVKALALAAVVVIGLGACASVPPSTPAFLAGDGTEVVGSISTIETVTLGGVEQTITIRTADRTKPVLLYLHGGPALPSSPWASWNNFRAELEANFVVVHWDQRGAGKSFSKELTPDDMHLENFVSDVLELTDLLRTRFDEEKIFLWGHSWGSGLGFETLRVDSTPFYAYFASAVRPDWNMTETFSYNHVLSVARDAGDTETVKELTDIAPFDPANPDHVNLVGECLAKYRIGDFHTEGLEEAFMDYAIQGHSPEYPPSTLQSVIDGMSFTRATLGVEIVTSGYDHARDFSASDIPVHFFAGRYDYCTPGELAYEYFESIEAPDKSFTWFENSAHNIQYDEPDKFNETLIGIASEVLGGEQ